MSSDTVDLSRKFTIVLCIKTTTHRQEIDAVDRFIRVGIVSYKKYMKLEDVHEIIVITPPKERFDIETRLKEAAPEFPWRVLSENDLVDPTLSVGWAKQQTAKMVISKRVRTPIYLIIDDDTFAVRPFGFDDLHFGAAPDAKPRVRFNRTPIDFPFFFYWSSEVMGADFEGLVQPQPFHMAITPEIFVTSVARDLVAYLERRHGGNWQKAIVDNKYTEYCVYWIFLLMRKETDKFYATGADAPPLYDAATTGAEHDLSTQMREAFRPGGNHIFSFVQTSLPVSTDAVLAEIKKYVPDF